MGARPLIIFGGLKTTQCALLHVGTDAAEEDEIPLVVMAGRMKKFSKNTSTIAEVMDPNTLNLRQILILNFKFSRFFFGGGRGPPSPFRVCASKPLSISKNFRDQHPLRAEI